MGYGVHFGGDVKPGWFGWAKDDITFHFTYGDGIGRYLNNNTDFALVTNYPNVAGGTVLPGQTLATATPTPATGASVRARTTIEWGGNVGYQHWWADNLRSTFSGGISHHDVNNLGGPWGVVCGAAGQATGAGGCGINKEVLTAHANLIWNPVPFVDFGLDTSTATASCSATSRAT